MSRAGTPTDNPIIESLNGWMKAELILDFGISKVSNLKKTLDQYVLYFNSERFAAALDYKTPIQYRTELGFWCYDFLFVSTFTWQMHFVKKPPPFGFSHSIRYPVKQDRAAANRSLQPLSACRKGFPPRWPYFPNFIKVLKMFDFNGTGHPSWISRAHPSLPSRENYLFIRKTRAAANRGLQPLCLNNKHNKHLNVCVWAFYALDSSI